jgi:hypothetical protein
MRSHSKPLLVVLALSSLMLGAAPPRTDPKTAPSDLEKQRQTVADMRNIGTAMYTWRLDQIGDVAAEEQHVDHARESDLADYFVISAEELKHLLVPEYIAWIPEKDGWGNPYEFRLNVKYALSQRVMMIRSAGRDEAYSASRYSVLGFDPESYDEDLVWADGFFVRWPERGTREISLPPINPARPNPPGGLGGS